MLKNYVKVAFRSLIKQRVYSVINIVGLSVGIASALLIALYVQYEFSYDKYIPNSDNIYKMALERKYPNHSTYYAVVPHSYSEVLASDIPEIKQVTRLTTPNNNVLVTYNDSTTEKKTLEENFVCFADSNFFKVFQLPFIKGAADKALVHLNDLVITESVAKRYFGDADPIGKTLDVGGNNPLVVTAVIRDLPENSHFKFDFVRNISANVFFRRENYTGFSTHMYVELNPGSNPNAVVSKIPKLVDTYAAAQIEQNLHKTWADYQKEGNGYRYFLQPLTGIHLDPANMEAKMEPGGSLNFIYFLLSIAVLLVVIACINFMNLATARSAERAREVGVRKTMGSQKAQLIYQFLAESTMLSTIATAMALLIIQLVLPYFNGLTERNLQFIFNLPLAAALVGLAILIGILAGSYPAFVLSAFNPVIVMKGSFHASKSGNWLRNGLVIFQFSISIILIVGTLVVRQQMQYLQSTSLGFDKEQMLVIERVNAISLENANSFVEEVRKVPEVVAAAGSASLPGRQRDFFGNQFIPEGSSEILTTKTMLVADDLAETIGLQLVEGSWFSKERQDSLTIILNETAVKTMGLQNPIGLKLSNVQQRREGNVTVAFTIIGVVKDFHFQSLRDQITPLVLINSENFGGGFGLVMARIKAGENAAAITAIEQKWKNIAPDQPFKYLFLDENFNANYKAEQQAGKLFAMFAGLAILVACVGLFGLSAYTAHLRTKEIGIRKVMGASVASTAILLARDFTRMVLIAFVIAIPASWYLVKQWLDGFAYRVDLTIGVFALAGIITILIAWFTVSFQTIKAALLNPVNSLRSE